MHEDLQLFFSSPQVPAQRQYEALCAYAMEGLSARQAAERYGFPVPWLDKRPLRIILIA